VIWIEESTREWPPINWEAEAEAEPEAKLGFGGPIESKITVGRTDALPTTAADTIADKQLSEYLDGLVSEIAFVRLVVRMSFRPAADERFERALLALELEALGAADEDQPLARALEPERRESGPYKVHKDSSFGFALHTLQVPVGVEVGRSSATDAEVRRSYVVAVGLGESDPEWRYQRTETMELEGTHEMDVLVQLRRGVAAEARLSLAGNVHKGLRTRHVTWKLDKSVATVSLPAR
jgi:hypothetical protein